MVQETYHLTFPSACIIYILYEVMPPMAETSNIIIIINAPLNVFCVNSHPATELIARYKKT
jgi:hypothetical protein